VSSRAALYSLPGQSSQRIRGCQIHLTSCFSPVAGLVKLAGGGEPAGNELWSMVVTDLSVRASMAEKRMRPEKRDVG